MLLNSTHIIILTLISIIPFVIIAINIYTSYIRRRNHTRAIRRRKKFKLIRGKKAI